MRVLFWSELFWPYRGGIETLGTEFLAAMRRRGYTFAVVASHDSLALPDVSDHDGIPVYRFPFRAALEQRDLAQLTTARRGVIKLKQDFQPDLVHLFAVGPSTWFHLQTRDVQPAPLLVTMHGEVLRSRAAGGESVLEKILLSADWVTGVSAAVLGAARQLVPAIGGRSSVVYSGLDAPPLAPRPLSIETPRLLCIGRLVPDKGFETALAAVARLVPRFPRLRLVIAGDGPLLSELHAQASALQITGHVEFRGWVAEDQVPDLMNDVTLVVMPSRREGLPLVAIQAAYMGRPVVATRVGGLPEVIIHGETGLLVEPGDETALADAVASLLEHPEMAGKLGNAATRHARERFHPERYLAAYETLYRGLVS